LTTRSNALAESFVDSFRTEPIADRVWRTRGKLELAIVEWVGSFNTAWLHEALGDRSPAEFELLAAATATPRGARGRAPARGPGPFQPRTYRSPSQ
jgi:transposase InsO family protein